MSQVACCNEVLYPGVERAVVVKGTIQIIVIILPSGDIAYAYRAIASVSEWGLLCSHAAYGATVIIGAIGLGKLQVLATAEQVLEAVGRGLAVAILQGGVTWAL